MTRFLTTVAACAVLSAPALAEAPATGAVLSTYADIALAKYTDALETARGLDAAIDALVANPSEATLSAAKAAWVSARVPYMQTEAYRFGNPVVDDWEGKVNAWPLDEGLIDYVAAGYGTESDANTFYTANVIANPSLVVGGQAIDAATIDAGLLQTLHEAGGIEANVATGYHAVEFLLWGQDLNGTGAGAGQRPATDFDAANCTNGDCERRADFLVAASELMLSDLEEIVAAWGQGGDARTQLMEELGLSAIVTGMGSLSYGEMAGERMKLGLLLHDPEEEHDCFADNTHNSHFYDVVGIQNVYLGRYKGVDGSITDGPSLSALVAASDADLDAEMRTKLDASIAAFSALKVRAETVEAYDQMIGEGNVQGNAVVQAAIDALVDQTRTIERVAALLDADITVEGSDSLDDPNAVFQ
ncbi:MAG: imelysin family protein [Pseudomonadota bacterium]